LDQLWEELYGYCIAFAGAEEANSWEHHRDFKVKGKIFVFTGGLKEDGIHLTAKPLPENRPMWLGQEGFAVAAYVGRFGWLSFTVKTAADLAKAKDLIAESYAMISKKRR
jgi:predicted DNA-binding protein (MmcQ/YjbR family)